MAFLVLKLDYMCTFLRHQMAKVTSLVPVSESGVQGEEKKPKSPLFNAGTLIGKKRKFSGRTLRNSVNLINARVF